MNEALRSLQNFLSDQIRMHGPIVPLDPPKSFTQKIMEIVDPAHPVHGLNSLNELRDYVSSTVLTPIDEDRTNAVFGEGNPSADIMLVGEAPGAEEDRTGKPFVGRAGQLLDKMLAAIDLSRQDIYIANTLKSRPPKNRNPNPDEISAHLPILYRQMSLVDPRFILCLGLVASQTLLGSHDSLTKLRQHTHSFYGATLLVTYHPAALLRNATWKRPTWEDLKQLRYLYQTK